MKSIPNKFIASIISGFIFVLVFTYLDYTPIELQHSNTYYYSFISLFLNGLLYIIPLFIVLGILVSSIIDRIIIMTGYFVKRNRYLSNVLMYFLMGLSVGVIITISFTSILNGKFLLAAIGSTVFGSLLFYHALILTDHLLSKVWKKLYEIVEK